MSESNHQRPLTAAEAERLADLLDNPPTPNGEFKQAASEHLKRQWSFEPIPLPGDISGIIGKWPGDESDEQVDKALEELS